MSLHFHPYPSILLADKDISERARMDRRASTQSSNLARMGNDLGSYPIRQHLDPYSGDLWRHVVGMARDGERIAARENS